ncbi:TolC family protein [Ilyobacter polytropus]|uniref:Outer membrane efflux protein n=1 Tax=Ilyobacter polytropus (strain ATCC 51220 / DSM 2926 / LMG 16218 / CuHBu1) TaxID=572544 RepID=E3H8Y2_ILYPC|nr:TolC family protein [Ilyobacter polytropus]ADO83536.1 outer membrane efflux protein [Ilyobacter polytropus DSM 2926]
MKNFLIVILITSLSMYAYSETITLDLNQCIERALSSSYTIKNADIDLENSKLQVREAYKEALPKISYTGLYDKNDESIYGDNQDRNDNYYNRIELIQPLYRGGLIGAGIEAAKKIRELSDYEFLESRSDLRLLVIEKYLNILKLQKGLEVYQASLKDVNGQYKKAQRKYELRLFSKADVLPFATRVRNIRTNIIRIKNEIKITELELKNEIGIHRKTELKLEPIDSMNYDLSGIDIEADVDLARENNRDSKMARLDYEITKANESLARSEFFPKVDLNFGYTGEDGDFDGASEDWKWDAGITVTMNLFEFGQNVDAYNRYKNETEKSRNLESKARDNIEVTLRSNFSELIRLKETVKEQQAAVESSYENYSVEKRRYENGLVSVVDLLQIESDLREAKLSLLEAALDYYLAYERYYEYLK